MIKTSITIISFLSVLLVNAQSEDWSLYADDGGVQVYFKKVQCNPEMGFDNESIMLKLVNSSGLNRTIEWDRWLWYNGNCKTCDEADLGDHKTIQLLPGQQLQGGCSVHSNQDLSLFVRFADTQYKNPNPQVLTKFELGNLLVR